MPAHHTDLHDARALVIDGNPRSRSILVSQLKEFGVGTIVQCSRLVDARTKLEMGTFDVVICEHYFEREELTGQDLLDDLVAMLPPEDEEAAETGIDVGVIRAEEAISTLPTLFMRFLPSFCFSSSFFLRDVSPP